MPEGWKTLNCLFSLCIIWVIFIEIPMPSFKYYGIKLARKFHEMTEETNAKAQA
jgi:hypothetical protein